jgi:hypothetical protein
MHVMDLPQAPDAPEAQATWTAMIRKLQRFLEAHLPDSDPRTNASRPRSARTNERNRLITWCSTMPRSRPPALGLGEMYDLIAALSSVVEHGGAAPLIEAALAKLERRAAEGVFPSAARRAPRGW